MSKENNIQTIYKLNDMVNKGDFLEIYNLFESDFIDHNPGWKVTNVSEFVSLIKQATKDFQVHNTILDTIAEDDKVTVRIRNEGVHAKDSFGLAATGKKTSIEIIEIYRFRNNKIAERWVQSDMLGFFSQIGAHFPFAEKSHASIEQNNLNTVKKILAAVNERNYEVLDSIMSADFKDHHPGIGDNVTSRENYKEALKYMHQALDMWAEVDFSFPHEDKVVTRVNLYGKHILPFMGIPPTDKEVHWTTIEVYRLDNGLIVERWAEDNLAGLANQMGVKLFQ